MRECDSVLLTDCRIVAGRIIFISSTTQYTGRHLVTHGASAKAGIDALSAQLAIELGYVGWLQAFVVA